MLAIRTINSSASRQESCVCVCVCVSMMRDEKFTVGIRRRNFSIAAIADGD